MSNRPILKKIEMLERVFTPKPDKPIIIEMWWPDQDAPEQVEASLDKAVDELVQGKDIVVIPYDTMERFHQMLGDRGIERETLH